MNWVGGRRARLRAKVERSRLRGPLLRGHHQANHTSSLQLPGDPHVDGDPRVLLAAQSHPANARAARLPSETKGLRRASKHAPAASLRRPHRRSPSPAPLPPRRTEYEHGTWALEDDEHHGRRALTAVDADEAAGGRAPWHDHHTEPPLLPQRRRQRHRHSNAETPLASPRVQASISRFHADADDMAMSDDSWASGASAAGGETYSVRRAWPLQSTAAGAASHYSGADGMVSPLGEGLSSGSEPTGADKAPPSAGPTGPRAGAQKSLNFDVEAWSSFLDARDAEHTGRVALEGDRPDASAEVKAARVDRTAARPQESHSAGHPSSGSPTAAATVAAQEGGNMPFSNLTAAPPGTTSVATQTTQTRGARVVEAVPQAAPGPARRPGFGGGGGGSSPLSTAEGKSPSTLYSEAAYLSTLALCAMTEPDQSWKKPGPRRK